MRVLTEDHPALRASGGRLLSRVYASLRLAADECSRRLSRLTEDHPVLRASGGRLFSRICVAIRLLGDECWSRRPRTSRAGVLDTGMKALGFALIAICGFAYLDMWVYQATAGFTLGLEGLRSPSLNVVLAERPRVDYAPGQSMGWIDIPRLGVSAVVAHGEDSRTLRRAVGHIPGTAFPGEAGNVVLAGHRDTFFRELEDIQASDVIRLVMPEGIYTYRVEATRIVEPDHVEVMEPTPAPALTLVTCYPFRYVGTAPYRFVIRAREERSSPHKRAVASHDSLEEQEPAVEAAPAR